MGGADSGPMDGFRASVFPGIADAEAQLRDVTAMRIAARPSQNSGTRPALPPLAAAKRRWQCSQ